VSSQLFTRLPFASINWAGHHYLKIQRHLDRPHGDLGSPEDSGSRFQHNEKRPRQTVCPNRNMIRPNSYIIYLTIETCSWSLSFFLVLMRSATHLSLSICGDSRLPSFGFPPSRWVENDSASSSRGSSGGDANKDIIIFYSTISNSKSLPYHHHEALHLHRYGMPLDACICSDDSGCQWWEKIIVNSWVIIHPCLIMYLSPHFCMMRASS
jgi:hypothetical protein